jgi:hypothetical protein
MKRRLAGWLKNAGLLFASLLIAALLAELFMAAMGINFDASIYTADRVCGWAYRPGASGYTVKEGHAYVVMNSDGMHDGEHAIEKPPGVLRIAVLGDSFSGAVEIDAKDAYWQVIEDRLGGCAPLAPKKIEVLNFGVGGYGTAQELMTLRTKVWKYSPDVVLLQMFFGNDIFNNERKLNDKYSGEIKVSPYFVYEGDELVLDNSFLASNTVDPGVIWRTNVANEIINRSRVLLLLYKARRDIVRPRGTPSGNAKDLDPGPMERLLFTPPQQPELVEAWRVTEGLLSLMDKEVREKGARLFVLPITHPVQVYPAPEARVALAQKLGAPDLFYPNDRVAEHGRSHGFEVLSISREMQAWSDGHPGVFLHGFDNAMLGQGHWNETGHKVAGELVADRLCASLGAAAATR